MTYSLRNGASKHRGVDANTIGTELERIRQREKGKLKPDAVVEQARSPRNPLHGAFTWDDNKAGHYYRQWEARALIRMVVVVHPDTAEQAPAFVHVSMNNAEDEHENYYQHSGVIARNATELEAALNESKRKLMQAQTSFEELKRIASAARNGKKKMPAINAVVNALQGAQAAAARI